MGCYNCAYLDMNNKKEGNINGCMYYCTKMKKYVNGAYDVCDSYSKDYLRKSYENNEIYNDSKHYYNGSNMSLSLRMIIIIILIVIAIICNV